MPSNICVCDGALRLEKMIMVPKRTFFHIPGVNFTNLFAQSTNVLTYNAFAIYFRKQNTKYMYVKTLHIYVYAVYQKKFVKAHEKNKILPNVGKIGL